MNDFKLDNEPKISSGFIAPDGYFDTFSEKVLTRIPKQEPKVIRLFSSKKTWYYAAVAILVLMFSIPTYNTIKLNQQQVDAATLENYIAYHSTISQDEIVELLNQEDINKMKMELNLDDAAIEDVLKSNPNLEEYITN